MRNVGTPVRDGRSGSGSGSGSESGSCTKLEEELEEGWRRKASRFGSYIQLDEHKENKIARVYRKILVVDVSFIICFLD